MHTDRLLKLADFLDNLPPDRFDYSLWVGYNWKGDPELSCGTTACALGWATTIPEFRELGLRISIFSGIPIYEGSVGIECAEDFFDLSCSGASYLFLPQIQRDEYGSNRSPNADASPREVAEHIRNFVKRYE